MFQNKFFSRRLRQKSEEIISRRISRFFHPSSNNNNLRHHVDFSDKLEIPTTPTSDWYYACPQHASADDMIMIVKEDVLIEPDLSICGASNTTFDDDILMYDVDPMAVGQEDDNEHQHHQQQHHMQLADHVRIVLGNAFEEADEQLEKEHLL